MLYICLCLAENMQQYPFGNGLAHGTPVPNSRSYVQKTAWTLHAEENWGNKLAPASRKNVTRPCALYLVPGSEYQY